MGGRFLGFLSGMLLTGSVTYLTAREFKSNQLAISQALRESIIEDRNTPILHKSNVVQFEQKTIGESVRDIWNYEVIKGVNWWYSLDLSKYFLSGVEKIVGESSKN